MTMKHHRRIAAGTTLALLMGSTALLAAPLSPRPASDTLILAQAQECPPDNPDCARGERPAAPAQENRREREEAPAEQPPAREQAPAERPAEPAPERPAPPPAAEQPAERPAPAERAAPPEQREAPAEREQPAPRREAPAPQPAPEAEQPRREAPREEAPAERAPAERPAPAPEAPAPAPAERQPGEGARQPVTPQPRGETPAPQPAPEGERPDRQRPGDAAPSQPAPAERPQPGAPAPEATPPAPPEQPGPRGEEGRQPAPVTPLPGGETPQPAPGDRAQPAPGTQPETPILDSQKETPPAPGGERREGAQQPPADGTRPGEAAQPPQPQEAGPPPATDREAQESAAPVEIEPVTAEEGKRIEADAVRQRRERPQGSEVLREIGGRVVIQFNNQTFVESDDRQRLSRGARDVYYEELPRGRTREVIQRENGVQVVTIRDRYGDVIRRSRITPDGREYVLVYAGDRDRRDEGPREWYDPGRDLPPLRLTIPVEDYILDAERVDDPDSYYEFLEQPPVERVRRLYSIDEVRHSARLRDTVRRIDLDTITFEFGSASVPESEIRRLEGVANAMSRLLEKNPAETFLIEGHTDAVGSDVANLALSDQRAAAVADALSNVFDIPPENLVPQGYGERYLKVNTQAPERENRRVAIRRITPLVAPAESASNR